MITVSPLGRAGPAPLIPYEAHHLRDGIFAPHHNATVSHELLQVSQHNRAANAVSEPTPIQAVIVLRRATIHSRAISQVMELFHHIPPLSIVLNAQICLVVLGAQIIYALRQLIVRRTPMYLGDLLPRAPIK